MSDGEEFFKDKGDDFSSGGSMSSFGGIPSDRVPMIEKIFKEVLGRKPSSRELAYYKYGVLKENDIRVKLLQSEEHAKLIADATTLPGIENELKSVRLSEIKLTQRIEDINQEILELQKLLNEKNFLIKGLREEIRNPYDLPSEVEKYEEGFDVYNKGEKSKKSEPKRKSLWSILNEIFEIIFK